jgi:hypothetical protein
MANFSPGFALKPWETKNAHSFIRNPEGVAIEHDQTTADPTLASSQTTSASPGLPKLNPGLELANAFSVSLIGNC